MQKRSIIIIIIMYKPGLFIIICPLIAHNSLSPISHLIFSLSPHHCTAGISNDVYPMSSSVKTMDMTVFTFKR